MKHAIFGGLAIGAVMAAASVAQAATFTPTFDTPTFPGTQFTVTSDPAYNAYYTENFGITVDNAYLYIDSRDTFDGVGIANGTVAEIGSSQAGRIDFLDTTNFVTIDYLALRTGIYNAYGLDGSLLSTFTADPGNGTQTLAGGLISYITFGGDGGYVTVSGLTYNYDGTTDGENTDLPSTVPVPAGLPLLLAGLAGLGVLARRRRDV